MAVFVRRPGPSSFSLERAHSDVVRAMSPEFGMRVEPVPHRTQGFRGVLPNMIFVRRRAGEVNHVFGDVHYAACALPRARTLLTIADCTTLVHRRGLRRAVLRLLWFTWPITCSTLVTAISESTRQQVLQLTRCHPDKVRVVPLPVSPSFRFVRKPFSAAQPIVLQVGTKHNKNVIRVIQALQGLNCHLRIVGTLSDLQHRALERFSVDYSCVSGISNQEMAREYRQSDMLVFASTYEGFGLPIVEAQATGRPVVTSNLCSMPEVAGDAACFVDPCSVADIRQGIRRVIDDEVYREQLIKMGNENVTRFQPVAIAKQYARVYEEMMQS